MSKVNNMEFLIKMDRPVVKDEHYFSPGGYELSATIGGEKRSIAFDFNTSYSTIQDDPTIMHCIVEDLDTDSFPEAEGLTSDFLLMVDEIVEFYVYTGEHNEPELHPQELLSLSFYMTDGSRIIVSDEILKKCPLDYAR